MQVSTSDATSTNAAVDPGLIPLEEAIEHAAHVLPAQGPITVFIHHNTLHAFEDLSFHEAVKKGAHLYGCQPYRTEDRYRDDLRRGRIRFSELQEVLLHDLGARAWESVPAVGTRFDLRLAMLQYPILYGPTEELTWYVAEADALRKTRPEVSSAVEARMVAETRRWVVRDLRGPADPESIGPARRPKAPSGNDKLAELLARSGESSMETWTDAQWEGFTLRALWTVCREGVRDVPPSAPHPGRPTRHRDLLFEVAGADSDSKVNEVLIPFCAAFLDQGLTRWQLPRRDDGFLKSFCSLHRRPGGSPDRWLRGLDKELARVDDRGVRPLESIRESLEILGVPEEEWEEFLSSTLLALRGWGGMVRQIEIRGDRAVHPIPTGSLVEFLAVRLILDRFAMAQAARDGLDYDGPLAGLREFLRGKRVENWPPSVEQRAFLAFQVVQLFGLSPNTLH